MSLRRAPLAIAALCASLAAFALIATPASAYTPRTYESQLSATGLLEPSALAIDSSNHVLVSDEVHGGFEGQISEFNFENEELPTKIIVPFDLSTFAADPSNGGVYVSSPSGVQIYSETGSFLESFPAEGFPAEGSVTVDNSTSPMRVYVGRSNIVELFDEKGEPVPFENPGHVGYVEANKLVGTTAGPFTGSGGTVAVGPNGDIYVADIGRVDKFQPSGEFLGEITAAGVPGGFNPTHIAVDPITGDLLAVSGSIVDEFSPSGTYPSAGTYLGQITGAETPSKSFLTIGGIAVNSNGYLYISDARNGYDPEHHFVDIYSPSVPLPKVTYPGVSGASEISPTESSATLNAEVQPDGGGEITTCKFEYVEGTEYRPSARNPFEAGHSVSCAQTLPYSGTASTQVSIEVSGITPGTAYRYRLLVGNASGTRESSPQTFDLQPPALGRTSASELTATSADLDVTVNPEGADTTCHFEYGTTTNYGKSVPCLHAEGLPEEDIGSFGAGQSISAPVSNLERATYHFRVVAKNIYGTTASEDQSFGFFPPNCPNASLRQQTGAGFLPDCRAYELVSPADAGGTLLFPEGPNSSQATSPSRFAFGGILGKIPGTGDPANDLGDLYVSTRTASGWVTHFVGLPGTQASEDNGPPNEILVASAGGIEESPGGQLSDLNMDRFMSWNDGNRGSGNETPYGSFAPYLRDSQGNSLGRLPTNVGLIADGETLAGAVEPSPDFSHYFFSSGPSEGPEEEEPRGPYISFAPGGLTRAPGSVYDNALGENAVQVISKLPNGDPIEAAGENPPDISLPFDGASTDGSHVLMEVNGVLYMRVGGGMGITYEIASGHAVHYVGMTADGTKVYFTSTEKLTPEDEDTSTNLYMWSEKGEEEHHPLTLISKPNGASATGTPICPATTWTTECGTVPYPTGGPEAAVPDSIEYHGPGGDGHSDNSIAAANGDIYFYSPAQLDGAKGIAGRRNLYDFHGGQIQYVTTFDTGSYCSSFFNSGCSEGPIVRLQVSPDDTHMAFLTASKITSYENAGFLEMYIYEPATGKLNCVSCLPSGAPPTSNVEASDNGIFMTDDGRTFFSTADALVPQDTDGLHDVYEYVEGRPQLISSGTSAIDTGLTALGHSGFGTAGLSGVSANGTDVYFDTYDTLVPQDRNGASRKFYDARTDGGFAVSSPPAPCAAADECTGPGTSPAPPSQNGTGAELGTLGNLAPHAGDAPKKHRKKNHKRRSYTKRRHSSHANRGGKK